MDSVKENKKLDEEAMSIYEYIVDNYDKCEEEMPTIIEKLRLTDKSGQFFASSAIYLSAIDRDRYSCWIDMLIEIAIEKDREHRYIGALLTSIWGDNYSENLDRLMVEDNNFRRIYKRLHAEENPM